MDSPVHSIPLIAAFNPLFSYFQPLCTSSVERMPNEIDSVLQALRRFEVTTHKVRGDRVTHLRYLNDTQATTRILVAEVLSLIFEYTCPPLYLDRENRRHNPRGWFSGRFYALKLGHVSHHWRQIAWSTPRLWASLSLHIYLRTRIQSITGLLDIYLTNSSGYPISLDLDLPPTPKAKDICEHIGTIIFNPNYSQRIGFLQVVNVPNGWSPPFSAFSNLSHLSLDGQSDAQGNSSDIVLTNLPALSHISLRNVNPKIELPWSSITVLELDSVTIDLCVELLTRCLNLVKFYARALHRPRLGWVPNTATLFCDKKLVYHNLKELRWNHFIDNHLLVLLKRIELPALSSLTWSQTGLTNTREGAADDSLPYIKALFYQTPESLYSVQFQHLSSWSNATWRYVLQRIDSTRELTLKYCHKETVRNLLQVLTTGPEISWLPSLRSLTINCFFEVSSEATYGAHQYFRVHVEDLIIRFLIARLERAEVLQFHLELLGVSPDWGGTLRRSLFDIVKKGMSLEVKIDGKQMDWSKYEDMGESKWKMVYC